MPAGSSLTSRRNTHIEAFTERRAAAVFQRQYLTGRTVCDWQRRLRRANARVRLSKGKKSDEEGESGAANPCSNLAKLLNHSALREQMLPYIMKVQENDPHD